MSKPAGYIVRTIIIVGLVLEVAACDVYADSTDGQTALVNFAIVFFAAVAIGVVEAIDYEVRRSRSRPRRGVKAAAKVA